MGVSVVMAAAGSESPRDPAVRASSPPNDTVLLLSSETMGVSAAVASADGATSLLTDVVLSLSSETAAVVSDDGATSLLTDAVLSLSSETAAVVSADGATSLLTDAVLSQSSEAVLTATAATVS